jgi:hypothetical protein
MSQQQIQRRLAQLRRTTEIKETERKLREKNKAEALKLLSSLLSSQVSSVTEVI